jgi:hypothetical protein
MKSIIVMVVVSTATIASAAEAPPPVTLEHAGPEPRRREKPIHPPVVLLDEDGGEVRASGGPLSLMKSCGACHDTGFIAEHNYHAQAGLDQLHAPGEGASGREWDLSPGLFGRWDPLIYRRLSSPGEKKPDLSTADWIRVMGPRHVGGGPAREPVIKDPRSWDWQESGTVELNCLLCHMEKPDNAARIRELRRGRFRWASTATLQGTGLVEERDGAWRWNGAGFDRDGAVDPGAIGISDPRSANCRLCHGKACRCTDPVVFKNSLDNWSVETTGTVFSPGRMFDSGMNLRGKAGLSTPWDVHAERLLRCADCHHSMNNPVYRTRDEQDPVHLRFDARRLDEGEYLRRPDHDLAKGHTAQGTVARRLDGSMRDCRDCHRAEAVHDFLPYKRVHFRKLACQTCHIPEVYAPVRKATDWTVLDSRGGPVVSHRGVNGRVNDPAALITGYQPVLLMQEEPGGELRLGPHNLVTAWFWVEGDPPRPVRRVDLERAYFQAEGVYHPEVVAALDVSGNGRLEHPELRLDAEGKTAVVAARLRAVGAERPRIRGEIQPYTVSHGVMAGGFAVRCCQCCHSYDSRVTSCVELAGFAPGGVLPGWVGDSRTSFHGELQIGATGRLTLEPGIDLDVVYIHGTNHLQWMDVLGIAALLGSLLAVLAHAALRILSAFRRKRSKPA